VAEVRDETSTARTLVLDVPGWPGHDAGQHVDVRLTPGRLHAVRSYSIASVADGDRIEITVEQVMDGEVSSYLAGVASVGIRWRCAGRSRLVRVAGGPDEPVQLVPAARASCR